ncbi:hypothetical protein DVS77_23185 [Mycolicibacterium moriokaense]|nr:hypothetical protein DVS77_23185 [Mycolicibacterium moriokaense]
MGAAKGYLTAVVAGAMTAGIGAANMVAAPEPDDSVAITESDLAAVEIPIIDIGPTPGPLSVWRYLAVQAGTNPLLLGLIQNAGNTYDLPGLTTTVDSSTNWFVSAARTADGLDFGSQSEQTQSNAFDLLGVLSSSADQSTGRELNFTPLFGGSKGIGAGLNGTLGESDVTRSLQFLGSGLDATGQRTVGAFDGELALLPWDGFQATAGGTAIDTHPELGFNLGSLTGSAGGNGRLSGEAGLCLGSAQSSSSCGGRTAFLTVGAPVDGGLTLAGNNIISGDFSTNEVALALKDGQFSAQGAVGGTVKIGNLEIGRPIPIDIQIPRTSSTMLSSRQAPTVRTSFVAVPGESASDNAGSSTGRHAAKDGVNAAISNVQKVVKATVSNATQSKPKHAKPDAED